MTDTVTVAVPEGVALTADTEQAWRAVELWPLRIERWTGDRWYVLIGLPLLLWITIGAVFAAKGTHYTNGILLFLAFALVLCAGLTASGIAFRLWHSRFRDAFPALLRARSLVTLGETTDECMQRFTIDYQRYLFSPWRYVLVGAIVAFTTGALFMMIDARYLWTWFRWLLVADRSALTVDFYAAPLLGVSQILVFVLWSYAVGVAAWVLFASGFLMWRLPRYFAFHIIVGHPDRCGGLRSIGSCCLGIAYPLAFGLVVLSIWGVLGRHTKLITSVSAAAALLFVVPLTIAAFILPLWQVHRKLRAKRDEYAMKYAAALEYNLGRLNAQAHSDDDATVKLLGDRVTAIRQLDPDSVHYPEWPFDARLFARFAAPQIIAAFIAIAAKVVG